MLDFWLFWRPCTRFLVIFTNLRPKMENVFLYFVIFWRLLDQKRGGGGTKCSIFSYFHQFVTRKDWTYCSIFGYFCGIGDLEGMELFLEIWLFWRVWHLKRVKLFLIKVLVIVTNFRPASRVPSGQFLAILTNLRQKRNELIARFFTILTNLRQ